MAGALHPNFTILTGIQDTWWSVFDAPRFERSWAVATPQQRYNISFVLGKFKRNHAPTPRPPSLKTTERLSVLSYLQAIMNVEDPTFTQVWGIGAQHPAAPSIADVWGPNPPNGATLQDCIATEMSEGKFTTWEAWLAFMMSAEGLAGTSRSYMNAQFTVLLALAKKGDMSSQFSRKSSRTLATTLGIDDVEIFYDEVQFIALKFINKVGFNDEGWAAFFNMVIRAAAEAERVRTVCGWAQRAGATKVTLLSRAYHEHPNFDWRAVEKRYPGEMKIADDCARIIRGEPYLVFHSPNRGGDWKPNGFKNAAHVAFLLLQADGDQSLGNYRGFENHPLPGLAKWRISIQNYCVNRENLLQEGGDFTAAQPLLIPGLENL